MSSINPVSFKVLTTLAAYRIVAADTGTANAVTYPAGATSRFVGVTTDSVKDTTGSIPVATHGIVKLYFNETMATGLPVTADASGRGTPFVDSSTGGYIVGTLIGPAVAATGTIADVLINIGWKEIP